MDETRQKNLALNQLRNLRLQLMKFQKDMKQCKNVDYKQAAITLMRLIDAATSVAGFGASSEDDLDFDKDDPFRLIEDDRVVSKVTFS